MADRILAGDDTASDYLGDLPITYSMDGLPEYPRYAVEDFDAAFQRFLILIGSDEPFGDRQERQLKADAAAYPELSLCGEEHVSLIMPEEQALDFVAAVTGHPRSWVACWNYRVTLSDLVTEHGSDKVALRFAFATAYRNALRYAVSK